MPSDKKYGTFDELIADVEPRSKKIARRLRSFIFDIHPDAVEVVRLGDRAATYGVGPKKMSEAYAYISPQKEYVNLGFFYGTSLEDPEGLQEGTGKAMRHVKVRSVEEADQPAVRRLIEAAFAERREALGLA